jgi:hypothetical protein
MREKHSTMNTTEPKPSPVDAIVEEWFVQTFHNRGLDEQLYNLARRQTDVLKARLAAALNKE